MGCVHKLWNPIRDATETAAVLGGNYLLPGSSLLTSNLASKGSQGQLNSTLGKVGQIGTGLAGAGVGSSFTGVPSASSIGAGWTNAADGLGGLAGLGDIGTSASNSISGLLGGGGAAGGVSGASPSGLSAADNSFLNSAKSGLSGALSTGTGGGSSSYGTLASLGGAANSLYANSKAQKELEDAGKNAQSQLAPYTASGAANNARLSDLLGTSGNSGAAGYGTLGADYTPGDLTKDPGYQFQLDQGNQALDRKQSASGNYFSGGALKAAEEYGTGLADNTYNNAFSRYQQQQQQQYGMLAGQAGAGQGAATASGNISEGIGNAQAAAEIGSANIVNQSLSSLLNGNGAKRAVVVDGKTYYV